MRVYDLFRGRLAHVVSQLALPPVAGTVLSTLAQMDLDPEMATQVRERDEHRRDGVLSWAVLLDAVPNPPDEAASAVVALAGWGIVQVVGAHAADVRVPGSAAMRLTFAGRVCLGLAPSALPGESATGDRPGSDVVEALAPRAALHPWIVLHCASRERLIARALAEVGRHGGLLRLGGDAGLVDLTAGEVAMALCGAGAAVVEALDAPTEGAVSALLTRTAAARGPRVLLLSEPRHARAAALAGGARMRWVPDEGGGLLDPALTAGLLAADPEAERSDVCGIPSSSLARPRRVRVPWSALELPDVTRHRLHLARLHAAARMKAQVGPLSGHGRPGGYRLLLCGLPGTGKSMTAAALATALDQPMLKVDLSVVLSKWLGETEKMLGEIFDLAEAASALLVLDEAESLFRQRDTGPGGSSGLATAVAFLLGRLDDFGGVLVATTNRVEDLDEAFYRRFDDYLVLPMPDIATRRRLWARMLGEAGIALEAAALAELAEGSAVSGGLIEGAALRARAWAEAAGMTLTLPIVLASMVLELEKSGRSSREVFAGRHADDVRAVLDGGLQAPPVPSPG